MRHTQTGAAPYRRDKVLTGAKGTHTMLIRRTDLNDGDINILHRGQITIDSLIIQRQQLCTTAIKPLAQTGHHEIVALPRCRMQTEIVGKVDTWKMYADKTYAITGF